MLQHGLFDQEDKLTGAQYQKAESVSPNKAIDGEMPESPPDK
jgi:hypothetical protein